MYIIIKCSFLKSVTAIIIDQGEVGQRGRSRTNDKQHINKHIKTMLHFLRDRVSKGKFIFRYY